MTREGQRRRPRNRGIWGVLLVALLVVGAGILHVARAKEELALRRGIWHEVRRIRALDDDRARIRRQVTELLAIPRTAVKAEVMGLRPVHRDQVLDLATAEE